MAFETQVNQWFTDNPNATPQQLANAVQAAGGLSANAGLADTIGARLGIGANEVTEAYGRLTAPTAVSAPSYTSGIASLPPTNYVNATPAYMATQPSPLPSPPPTPAPAPQTVEQLYGSVLGRPSDEGGFKYWSDMFGPTIEPEEVATFKSVAAQELAARPPIAPDIVTPYTKPFTPQPAADPVQAAVSKWAADNPNATPYQITQAITEAGGLTPALASAVAKQYGTTVDEINAGYANNKNINDLYQTYLGRAPESQEVVDYWAKQFGATIEPEEIAAYRRAAEPELKQTGYLSDPFKNEVKDYVSSVLSDNSLGAWEKTNKIMEQAQKSGVTQAQLESIYGKDAVAPYMDTYKTGINDYINKALATDPTKTTFDEVGQIHQAATKYGLSAEDIAKYGGIDQKTAQSYFDMYDRGLGTIVASLNDPKVDDVSKTKTALALASKYGATDAELAKASNGKWTEKDVAAYLDPVRNVPTNLQKLFDDPNATAADIQKFVTEAKLDPRAAGIFGAALDKVATSTPELYLRDAANGKADVSDSYDSFLAVAKSTPEMATKYAPQIQAIESAKNLIGKHALNKDFGGEYKDYAMQMFLGLDKNTTKQAPKQLEFTERKTDTATGVDEYGNVFEYERELSPVKPKGEGVEPVYEYNYGDDGGGSTLTGYRQKIDSDEFGKQPVYATFDAGGKHTGYESDAKVYTGNRTYYGAKWNADGSPAPYGVQKSRGGFGGFMDSFAELGPIGTIALMAATGGLGSLAAGALANTAVGAALGTIGTNAVASGLVSGALSEMGGGEFGKGFVGGAVGSGVGSLAQGAMPTGGFTTTGVPMVDSYLTQAIPKAAGSMASTGVLGGDMGDAGLYSLLNTGVNMGTNSLLQNSGIGTLPTSVQPYATGVASNVISSALTGKDPDLEKAITKTMMQQAMSTGKSALKTAAKP